MLDKLDQATLHTALEYGRVIVLATHGDAGYAKTSYASEILCVWPADTGVTDAKGNSRFLRVSVLGPDKTWGKSEDVAVNSQLQVAYIFACNAGKRASQWQEHLAPAQVITYNRASTVWDHAVWFALTGPTLLQKLNSRHVQPSSTSGRNAMAAPHKTNALTPSNKHRHE